MLGEVSHGVAQLIVRAIEPGDDLTAKITCVDAAPDVWTADSGTPPDFVSEISGTAWCSAPDAPVVTIRTGNSAPDDGGIIHVHTGVKPVPQPGVFRIPGGSPGKPRQRMVAI